MKHIFSALIAAAVTGSGVLALVFEASVAPVAAASAAPAATILAADARGRPILLARMVVSATPLAR